MKTNWQTKNIEDCIEDVTYTKKIQRKDFLEFGNFPIVSQEQELINGYWNNKKDLFRVEKPLVVFGDHTQILKYVDFDFMLGADGVKILQPKEFLYPKYFYYFLQNIKLESLGYARHYRLLKEKYINYPESISEQKRIVKILDETFKKLEKAKEITEKNLQNSKELFNSYLDNIFVNSDGDWNKVKIGEVCILKSGTTISKNLEKHKGDILYVKVGDMNLPGNEIEITSSSRYVDLKDLNRNQIIPEGSIIFPKRGGAIFTNKRRKITKPTIVDLNTMALVPSDLLLSNFLYYWFLRIDLTDLNNGSSIPQINNYSFDNIFISFPKSLDEQKIIIKKLDQLSEQTKKLESIYQKKISAIEELKKSILNKAFSRGL
ncbi:MAG: restriction endonuclease subunit S [Candidatus Woesearchaeota archaeon]